MRNRTSLPARHRPGGALSRAVALALSAILALSACTPAPAAGGVEKIKHLIVIVQENWSFDGLYGHFPGANGIANAGASIAQVDKQGRPYATLPQALISGKPDTRFPAGLPVAPWNVATYVSPTQQTGDLVHRFYQEQYEIDGGKMDGYVAWSDAGALALSYYDATNMPVGKLAQKYVLADNFFHAAFGGSFLNHFWLVCACSPVWPNAPKSVRIRLDTSGRILEDGIVTPDGYAVNTVLARNPPLPNPAPDPSTLLPLQTQPTIGDRLTDKNVSWAWYAGGWNNALAGKPAESFQYHHQALNYFANYAVGQPGREHLKDTEDFRAALQNGTLPAVAFVKPLGDNTEHPNYTSLLKGEQYVAGLVQAIKASGYWKDTAIIIVYDENGGRWDHVAPPKVDVWGPGTRVPMIVISPYARHGFVDHTLYDTTSILKFIEVRWGLAPLGTRDAAANNILNAFDFSQQP